MKIIDLSMLCVVSTVVSNFSAVAQSAEPTVSIYDSLINSALNVHLLYEQSRQVESGSLMRFKKSLTAVSDDNDYLFFEPGVITIEEDRSAQEVLERSENREQSKSVMGFRIGVFFSNQANGRAEANKVVEKCAVEFADVPTSLIYDNPSFKVHAGYAITNEEAVMLLSRLQKRFPKAYIIRERVEPKDLVETYWKQQEANNTVQQIKLMSELINSDEAQ